MRIISQNRDLDISYEATHIKVYEDTIYASINNEWIIIGEYYNVSNIINEIYDKYLENSNSIYYMPYI